ncbi:Bax inhibitor-1 family protein [Burkholderiaceae bacterium UC74_6]
MNNQNVFSNVTTIANPAETNRVLRNTYALLALSMIPTVLGAWLGLATGLMASMAGLIITLVASFALIFVIKKTQNSAMGVFWLLAFTFVMGMMLSGSIGLVLHKKGGAEIVMLAFSATAAIFFGMATLSSVIKRDLSSMGKFLFIGLILVVVASLANIFLQSSALMITVATISAGLFSAFILYDLKTVRDGLETNYVSATLSIYLDLVNLFTSLLQILGFIGGRDE